MDNTALPEPEPTDNTSEHDGTETDPVPPPPGPTGDPDVDLSPELVIATFPDRASALEAFRGDNGIKWAERHEQVLLIDAAVVHRDEGNKLHVEDEQDWPGRMGALQGAGIGTILGLVAGPLGMVIGGAAGALIGAGAAARSDAGMSDERLMEFAAVLKPGTSMIIAAVAHRWSETTAAILARDGGDVNTIPLTGELARQLHLAHELDLDQPRR